MTRRSAAESAGELLKLLRANWLSREDIRDWSGWGIDAVRSWLRTWMQLGILESKLMKGKTRPVEHFHVAAHWIRDSQLDQGEVIRLAVHPADDDLPDADTDVIVFEDGETEGQLGALVGHGDDGPEWVDAQGRSITVTGWCELPVRAHGRVAEVIATRGGELVDLRAGWKLPA